MPRPTRSRIAAALGAVLLTLVLLELGSCALFERIAGEPFDRAVLAAERAAVLAQTRAELGPARGAEATVAPHPYVGYVGRPGSAVRYFTLGDGSPVYNEYGMLSARDRAFPSRTGPDRLVIGVLGGSVAELFANTQEAVLERYLRQFVPGFDREVVMISLGTGGWKQPQGLYELEYALLLGFQFDVVVAIDGFNDLVFATLNAKDGIQPVFPSGYHMGFLYQLETRGVLAPRTVEALHEYYASQRSLARVLSWVDAPLLRRSAFANLVGAVWLRRGTRRAQELRFRATMDMPKEVDPELRGPRRPWPRNPYKMAARLWRDASLMTDSVCRARGIPYVHLLQPNQYVEGSKPLSDEERERAYRPDHPWGQQARRGWKFLAAAGAQLRKRGVAFYDLTMIFQKRHETLYLDDCCHFGRLGNEILAANLARILERELGASLAAPAPRPDPSAAPPAPAPGDLAEPD